MKKKKKKWHFWQLMFQIRKISSSNDFCLITAKNTDTDLYVLTALTSC